MLPPEKKRRRRAETADPGEARSARRRRAEEESFDLRPEPVARCVGLEVRNPAHRTRYFVSLPSYPDVSDALCTCPDFARRALGTCKHVEAALLWLHSPAHREALEAPRPRPDEGEVRRTWEEVDRRLRERGPPRPRRIDALAYPGRALIEGPADRR